MNRLDHFTDDELRELVNSCLSYRELIQKCGYKSGNGNNIATIKRRLERCGISTSHFQARGHIGITRSNDNVFCKDSTAGQQVLKRWYIKLNCVPYECNVCGISEWEGQPLTLQLDHINGDNTDNRLENLRWLCPNCHSQTDTFCGKQKRKNHWTRYGITTVEQDNYCIDCGRKISKTAIRCLTCDRLLQRRVERPTKEELEALLISCNGNFREVGRKYGVTDNAIRKWCKQMGIPHRSADYKK